jgi:hypothetical protein
MVTFCVIGNDNTGVLLTKLRQVLEIQTERYIF